MKSYSFVFTALAFAGVFSTASVNANSQQDLQQLLDSRHWHRVCVNEASELSLTVPRAAVRRALEQGAYLGYCARNGDKRKIGNGHMVAFEQRTPSGEPHALGFRFSAATLHNLPMMPSDGATCYDRNGDGHIDLHDHAECVGGHALELNFASTDHVLAPFKWGLINWNVHGHAPMGIYDQPHFDFHFYTQSFSARNLIRTGECGMLIHCDDFQRAIAEVPFTQMPSGYASVGAAEARMGNHLIDPSAPEFNGAPFTHTFIFGSYDGKLTFWEPMISLALLQQQPFFCAPIAQSVSVAETGQYPQRYCVKYYSARQEYMVTLEDFAYRAAH